MEYTDVLFYLFAAVTVVSAWIVVTARNVIRSAFSLLFTFVGVAGLYVLLLADFIAVVQIMVYVGGILVLLIFGVMLTRKIASVDIMAESVQGLPAFLIVGVLLGTLTLFLTGSQWRTAAMPVELAGTTREIGELLMTSWLLPFETSAVVLLVAIMGAAMIARKD